MALAVPYNPVPSVTPQSPGESVSVSTPDAAFGVNIGNALQHLGSSTAEAGTELFNRAIAIQDLTNQADARNAVTKLMDTMAKPRADFLALKEKDAVNGLQPYLDLANNTNKDIRSTLTSPMAQKYYDQESSFFMRNNVIAASGHAGTEGKAYVVGTATSGAWLAANGLTDPNSDIEFHQRLGNINGKVDTIKHEEGWSDEQAQEATIKFTSHAWANRIDQINQTNPQAALVKYNEAVANGQITGDDQKVIYDRILAKNRTVGTRVLGDQIIADNKDKPIEAMVADAEKRAPAVSMGDPEYLKDLENYIRQRVNYGRWAVQQQNEQGKSDIITGIAKYEPHSAAELLTQPGMQSAYDMMKPIEQAGLQKLIGSYWSSKQRLATALGEEQYNSLRAMAVSDPQAFLEQDPSTWKVSSGQLVGLIQLRAKVTRGEDIDPHMKQAMTFMHNNFGAELNALGVYSRNKNDPEEYDKYTSALYQAINSWMETHNGKAPDNNQMFELGKGVLKTHTVKGWFTNSEEPTYDIPQDVLDSVGADVKKSVPDATPEEIRRAALRQIYITQFGGSSGGSKPAAKPGQQSSPVPISD